ncbi:MAG TPA: hypothetical protein VIF10_12510 [Methylobacter sp.]|jgi:hypothetical protein
MMNHAIASYSGFLVELKIRLRLSTALRCPPLQYGNDWDDIANARREVIAPQTVRTALSQEFNRTMQLFLRAKRYPLHHDG